MGDKPQIEKNYDWLVQGMKSKILGTFGALIVGALLLVSRGFFPELGSSFAASLFSSSTSSLIATYGNQNIGDNSSGNFQIQGEVITIIPKQEAQPEAAQKESDPCEGRSILEGNHISGSKTGILYIGTKEGIPCISNNTFENTETSVDLQTTN
jgi:hypothetical protein